MTEQEALASTSGWADRTGRFVGYLSLAAANALVATGRYQFYQATCWGYIVERKEQRA